MAAVTYTKEKIGVVYPQKAVIDTGIAAEAIEAGQPLCINSNGKYALADANGSGLNKFRGMALETVAAGQAISVLREGEVYGFALSSLAFDAAVYVSDTVGTYDDSAGTTSLVAGRVCPIADASGIGKVLLVTGFAG